jgi:hypothetical protein
MNKTVKQAVKNIEGYEAELRDRARVRREHEDQAWQEWWDGGGIFEALGCPDLAVKPSERTEKQNLKIMLHNIKRNMKDESK